MLNSGMDPFTRLTMFIWQFSRRRHSKTQLIFYAAVLAISLIIGLIEWAGYAPEALKVERTGVPRIVRP